MNPPPPTPQEKGSTTPRAAAAATAASIALPPRRRMSIATIVAIGSTLAAAPPAPTAVACLAGVGRAASPGGAASKRTEKLATTAKAGPNQLLQMRQALRCEQLVVGTRPVKLGLGRVIPRDAQRGHPVLDLPGDRRPVGRQAAQRALGLGSARDHEVVATRVRLRRVREGVEAGLRGRLELGRDVRASARDVSVHRRLPPLPLRHVAAVEVLPLGPAEWLRNAQ